METTKNKEMKPNYTKWGLGAAIILATPVARAAITQTNTATSGSDVSISVSTTDLINTGATSLSSVSVTGFTQHSTAVHSNLNDGSVGTSINVSDPAGTATVTADVTDGAWVSTYTLNTTLNTLGYDITDIRTIAGWQGLRAYQNVEVLYSVVGDSNFVSLGTFTNYYASTGTSGTRYSTQIQLTDTTGTIATGVDEIRFNVLKPVNDGTSSDFRFVETFYREFDVQGVAASVPEPSALALGGLAFGLLLRRRRTA